MLTPAQLAEALGRTRLLSAAVIERPEHAGPLACALLEGGLDVMEVTFRNMHAAECIRRIRAEVPAMRVGAGTLLSATQVDEARAAGAEFGVTPGFNPAVVRHAVGTGFPLAPGVLTPGEMEQSLALGCPVVKLFPAGAAGGPDYIRAIAAPYAHTPLRLVPLGGVNEASLATYLALPLVLAVGGSWLTDRALVAAGRWDEITARTRRACELAARKPRP
jgi:2-dehydro-3-deoxyphosphogluconate aldolase/(4S)-4-hydroxy-2-oxoglutarate aldolase